MPSRPTVPLTFGARLKERRDLRGLTQEELGAKLGVKGSTVSHWENGLHDPPVTALLEMRQIFGVTLDWLLGAPNTPPPMLINIKALLRARRMVSGLADELHGAGAAAADLEAALAAALPQERKPE